MKTRLERDALGEVRVPNARLWGAQTQRALEHFDISHEKMPAQLIQALVLVKKAATLANVQLGVLPKSRGHAIIAAADEVLSGKHAGEFPLSVWQTGSGTQTHMNVNEVLANRASQLLGGPRGRRRLVHPNDDVNASQSSNDVFPTAMHVAAVEAMDSLLIQQEALLASLRRLTKRFHQTLKVGRTHLQDAAPLTLGQEFSSYVAQLSAAQKRLRSARRHLYPLALGGTAVGTGLNAPRGFSALAVRHLARLTQRPFVSAPNKFEALACHDALVYAHGVVKQLAVSVFKMANDIRLLASGPRAGLGELILPANEPGSSIMPGKINPTQAEALTMACVQIMGNDLAVSWAGASGHLQLNVYKPVLAYNFLQSVRLITDGMESFRRYCVEGIMPNEVRLRENLEHSLVGVTALVPHLGYDLASKIAQRAYQDGSTLKAAALALDALNESQFDAWVRLDKMV